MPDNKHKEARRQLIEVGIRMPNSGPLAGRDAILGLGREAAKLGFDSLWVHDHLTWAPQNLTHFAMGSIEACQDQDPLFYESVSTVGVLGGHIPDIKLGIAGLALPLRDPRPLARQLATIDALVGPGRMTLAVGVGSQRADFELMGVPFQRRGKITNDYLAALRTLLRSQPPATFASDTVTFKDASFYPVGEQVQLWVAGHSEAALRRTVQLADGWLTAFLTVEKFTEASAALDATAAEHDVDPASLARAVETWVCAAATHEEAVGIARASLEHSSGSLEAGLERAIIGGPAEVAERIASYSTAGADRFELRPIGHDVSAVADMMAIIAEEVLPTVRGLTRVTSRLR